MILFKEKYFEAFRKFRHKLIFKFSLWIVELRILYSLFMYSNYEYPTDAAAIIINLPIINYVYLVLLKKQVSLLFR